MDKFLTYTSSISADPRNLVYGLLPSNSVNVKRRSSGYTSSAYKNIYERKANLFLHDPVNDSTRLGSSPEYINIALSLSSKEALHSISRFNDLVRARRKLFRSSGDFNNVNGDSLVERLEKEADGAERVKDDVEHRLGIGDDKTIECTADELHYVTAGKWRLAMWRYLPNPDAPKRNHPVLLLCGIATNALGYDLHPDVSLARHLAQLGFDTWILEVRGAGLSYLQQGVDELSQDVKARARSGANGAANGNLDSNSSAAPSTGAIAGNQMGDSVTSEGKPQDVITTYDDKRAPGQVLDAVGEKLEPAHLVSLQNKSQNQVEELLVVNDRTNGGLLAGGVALLKEQLYGLVEDPSGSRAAVSERVGVLRELLGKLADEVAKKGALREPLLELTDQLARLLDDDQRTAVSKRMANLQSSLERLRREGQKVGIPASITIITDRLTGVLDEERREWLSQQLGAVRTRLSRVLQEGQAEALSFRVGELRNRLTSALEEGRQRSGVATRAASLQARLARLIENGQTVASPRMAELSSRMATILLDTRKTLRLISNYDWDFDNYLFEDLPAAMAYMVQISKPQDGNILAVGHSMGGILLYCHLAAREPSKAGLSGVVTVASSLEYHMSNTSLKLALPLASPAQLMNLPVVPMGVLIRNALPFILHPPYSLAYIGYQISAHGAMKPSHFRKLLLNNFCTIPLKLLLQMASVFQPGGLQRRDGAVSYREGLEDCSIPVLALAAKQDLICPPVAVQDTLKALPKGIATYKLFGEAEGRPYGHYDMLVGRHAKRETFPVIAEFLAEHDVLRAQKADD